MAFNQQVIEFVWQKGFTDSRYDAALYRKDRYGSWMKKSDYGNRSSKYGWEIDHTIPVARGGSDTLSNLQPLYWENNAQKQDGLI